MGSGEKKEEKQRTELIIISFATNNNSKYLCTAYLFIGARCSLSANSSNSHDNPAIYSPFADEDAKAQKGQKCLKIACNSNQGG